MTIATTEPVQSEDVELSCDLGAELVESMGSDLAIVNAARVSLNQHSDELSEKDTGLVRFLMSNRHASPFEHCTATFLITAPIFVAREWHRHRTQSFNEVSGRYTELKPKFYAPDYDRPLIQTGKPGAYKFELGDDDATLLLYREMRFSYQTAWYCYQNLLKKGIAKEVARNCLPVGIYTSWYATANLRNWINFLSLRAEEHALWEIRKLAYSIEDQLCTLYPITMNEWGKSGRGPL